MSYTPKPSFIGFFCVKIRWSVYLVALPKNVFVGFKWRKCQWFLFSFSIGNPQEHDFFFYTGFAGSEVPLIMERFGWYWEAQVKYDLDTWHEVPSITQVLLHLQQLWVRDSRVERLCFFKETLSPSLNHFLCLLGHLFLLQNSSKAMGP